MKIYLQIILLFLFSSATSATATKQYSLDGIELGTRVDKLGITLDEYQSIYTYKTMYLLWGNFQEKGHPIFAIEKLCKESDYSASLDGIGCNQNYQDLKKIMGSRIVPICDAERYDEDQTPYAYYDASTNHFWMVSGEKKIFSVGIATGVDGLPGAEGGSQVCKPISKEALARKKKVLQEASEQEAKKREKERTKQLAKEKLQKEFVASLLSRRKTSWVSWPNYGFTLAYASSDYVRTDYYFDPKSVTSTKDGKLILIREDTPDYDSIALSLIEINCKKEMYRKFQQAIFSMPIQATKLKEIKEYDGKWNYVDPTLIHAELYKKVCD